MSSQRNLLLCLENEFLCNKVYHVNFGNDFGSILAWLWVSKLGALGFAGAWKCYPGAPGRHLRPILAPRPFTMKFCKHLTPTWGASGGQVGRKRAPGRLRERLFEASKNIVKIEGSRNPFPIDF